MVDFDRFQTAPRPVDVTSSDDLDRRRGERALAHCVLDADQLLSVGGTVG